MRTFLLFTLVQGKKSLHFNIQDVHWQCKAFEFIEDQRG